jgi:hypothetical protein
MRSGPDQRPRGRFGGDRPSPQQPRAQQGNRSLDSNGPNVKIRGSAHQIFERYIALAGEAAIGDDRVAAENYYQHAEHYFRSSKENRAGSQQGSSARPTTPADVEMNSPQDQSREMEESRQQSGREGDDAALGGTPTRDRGSHGGTTTNG